MMRFVDRENDLAALEQEYGAERASFVVLYGRRRLGKTTLIQHFLQNKDGVYFLATEESEAMNREAFQGILADSLQDALLSSARLERWEPIFQRLAEAAKSKRLVLVIDEFQYLGRNNPAFLSVFQRCWDTILSHANIMLILCGSLVSMMLSQTLRYDSPLYGRRTAQLRLRPIPFSYYGEFFEEGADEAELVERYSITGGVPKYIQSINFSGGIDAAVERDILNPAGFLFDEPNFLLQKEVTEIGSYFSVLRVIAAGNHKLSNIATCLQQKQSNLTKYLKVLIDLDILEREVPVTEANPEKSKKGLYQIRDPYIRFWFRFIYPYLSYIEMGHTEIVMAQLKKNFIDTQVSFVYEAVCQEKLWKLSAEGSLPGLLERVGRWWDGSHEIDVAGVSEQDRLLVLGECKFWKGPVGVNILIELEKKAEYVSWRNGDRRVVYVLFSIHGFSEELLALAKQRDDLLLLQ